MSDIKKEDLKKEVMAVLKDADLAKISSKKVRQQIEERLDADLSSRKKEIDELVMAYIDKKDAKPKNKKNGDVNENDEGDDDDEAGDEEDDEEEDEEESESEEEKKPKRVAAKKAGPSKRKKASSEESDEGARSDDEEGDDDDEYSPKKKGPAKKAGGKRGGKKKGDTDDSDEDWGKGQKRKAKKAAGGPKRGGGGGGYTKPVRLSKELSELLGETSMPRHEVVKRMWAIIKERNLSDPKNKQYAICDDALLKVFGVKRFRTFGMMKFLKNHFITE